MCEEFRMTKKINILPLIIIILLFITSIFGILSFDSGNSYEVTNQYGEVVKMYGSGIYAHDTYFKAPISIGTDFCILFILIPLFVYFYWKNEKENSDKTHLLLLSVDAVALYYAASIAFGVTYNQLHLVYIALFSCSLFELFREYRKIHLGALRYNKGKGVFVFLILTGTALIIAWMPDIIPTLFDGGTLALIGVYTTEITYVLDMGIIGPLCLVTVYLLRKEEKLAIIILSALFMTCILVGIMMIPQTLCLMASGIELPLPQILTKSGSFLLLSFFAFYFNRKLYKEL